MRATRTAWNRFSGRNQGRRTGIVLVLTAIGLVCLLAFTALVLDLGRGVLATQRCQNVADAAAMAGASGIPYAATAISRVQEIVTANNQQMGPQMQVTVNPASDITIYPPNSTGTGLGGIYENLGPDAYVIKVTGRIWVPYYFAKALNLLGANCQRSATVYIGPLSGTQIGPIWMWFQNGIYQPGVVYNVYEGQQGANIQSFGLAAFANNSGSSSIEQYLEGNNLTSAQIQAATFNIGDTLPVVNGNHGGAWKAGFYNNPDGLLYRASRPPYDTQTPTNYTPDNPRIIIIPLLHGNPSSGSSVIDAFGAFWVISGDFAGNHSQFSGQFLFYETVPTGVPNPGGTGPVRVIKLIK
jgi:hypothetical protein